ncbi:DUF6110 family protein [Facklamia miroungae]|uniref:Uncharacterized protein n=1 Tax=Facklamia miroungae TaxID=120956 RepID=A0A1G7QB20_9LACT|nr:DUF6110 family protein [Facklamia miroungae]NKZ28884.1 hypothetical protein [Facklamia miroungae]SDF95693.1 hypothetical protein SAMN05421791_10232 [Facklamia miroungae]
MLKNLKKATELSKSSGLFLGGALFGSLGLKLLTSRKAKEKYAEVIAKSYQLKDELDASVSTIKQHTDDVLADAQEIYLAQKQQEQAESIEDIEGSNEV